ncbi:hypothetical protein M0R45_014971 [Rubus argutus]|uniref:PiggyBac transposable element-derived protein domain-containing protein n=1 Tax=Rubus argutus TaxID=59490 RepID=A0AAW1XQB6_RUBAR
MRNDEPWYETELEACEDSDDEFLNEEFNNELNEDEFQGPDVSMSPHEDQTCSKDDMSDCLEEESTQVPIIEPLFPSHERTLDVSSPHSSYTFVPSIQEALEFHKGPHEPPLFQYHVEMVIGEPPLPHTKNYLAMYIEPDKRRQRWKKRKKKKSLELYFSIHGQGTEVDNKSTCNIIEEVFHEEDNEVPCQVFKRS